MNRSIATVIVAPMTTKGRRHPKSRAFGSGRNVCRVETKEPDGNHVTGKRILYIWSVLYILIASSSCVNSSELASHLIKAHRENQPIPLVSELCRGLDEKTAYKVQKAYVEKRLTDDKVAGFKAGLTSEEMQKRFGVDFPVAGVLFESGREMNESVIEKSDFKSLMIETEIGFVVGKPIREKVKDISELQGSIQAVMPVIELPDLGFSDVKKIKAVDIIAANVSSARFIAGREVDRKELSSRKLNGINLNDFTITLSLDGRIVNQGKGIDALGNQWEAALWLVNAVLDQGWNIEPGHILITGVLGNMVPGKSGKYMADYGNLGKVSFEVR